MERKCGDCNRCCDLIGVDELGKPPDTPCNKLCGTGCSIYGQHPRSCRDYACAWLMGFLREHNRPDELGAVFDIKTSPEEISCHLDEGKALNDEIRAKARRLRMDTGIERIVYYPYGCLAPMGYAIAPEYQTEHGKRIAEVSKAVRCGKAHVLVSHFKGGDGWEYMAKTEIQQLVA